jgi:glycosyltransferase involved in cell wall biosynthesis
VLGGAEQACRMLAERLVATAGWEVHVFTTCATDAVTWADDLEPGHAEINGVHVHRFASCAGRSPEFDAFARDALLRPGAADGRRFVALQGPVCPDAVEAAVASDARLIVFYPYLYWPTVHGVAPAGRRAVMHPAAHDEPALRLEVFREVFAAAHGMVFQTDAERALVHSCFAPRAAHEIVLGLGVDEPPRPGDPGRRAPFLLYVGRVEDGKGTRLLADVFAKYKASHPGPLELVLAGVVNQAPPEHPDIAVLGPVSEDEKHALMAGCVAFVQPSYYEAFSLVVMEAWMAGAPVIVNGACAPLLEHVERSGGGLVFTDDATFDAAVSQVVTRRDELARRGRAYVQRNFGWPRVIERYRRFLTRVAATVPADVPGRL